MANILDLKFIVVLGHVEGPGELLSLGLVVDLLHGDVPFLTPADKRITRGSAIFILTSIHCGSTAFMNSERGVPTRPAGLWSYQATEMRGSR